MSTRQFAPHLYSAGQPSPADLARLQRMGVRTVINLRQATEATDFDQSGLIAMLGMREVRLPIAGAADLDADRIAEFGRLLREAMERGDVLIHCASANRVGALVALDAAINQGLATTDALQLGRDAGLSGLEPAVVECLQSLRSTNPVSA